MKNISQRFFCYFCTKLTELKFSSSAFDLPVCDILDQVKDTLQANSTLIVTAPPGAGKSTILPLSLLDTSFLAGKKILMLEPRRLAAKSIALRMAALLDEPVGETIGYRIRFENKVSDRTKIEVLTEGILTRMLHSDNALENVGLVIFDEFHERNIHADLAMALCREAQQVLRPDLRIMVMSATLDMPLLSKLLEAPTLVSKGKMYPVEVRYTGDYDLFSMPEMLSQIVIQASKENEGDILAFLPGQGEIKKTEAILRSNLRDFSIHPLYGQLSPAAQHQAIMPRKDGKRKVVLATSIAETSLTIEGIKVVVDCGYGRTSKFNPRSGLSRLETVAISKDAADQRAGRSGRLGPGVCYRMWSLASHAHLDNFRTPEIQEADLAPLVLDLVKWGVENVDNLTWLSPPPRGSVSQALDLLEQLEAIQDGKLTDHGKTIHSIPAHPRIAHMLLKAKEMGNVPLATDIAALLEERDPLKPEIGVDINLRLEAIRRARKEKFSIKGIRKIEKIASQYRRLLVEEEDNGIFDPFEAGLLIAYAYPERIASARPGNNAQFQLANGKIAMMGHRDELAHESWIAISHVDERDGMGKIFMAAPINPTDLRPLLQEKRIVKWDKQSEEFIAIKTLGIGSIVLRSTPVTDVHPDEKINALIPVIHQDIERHLNFNDDAIQLLRRVSLLKVTNPDMDFPDYSKNWLKQNLKECMGHYLQNIRSAEDLKKLDIKEILFSRMEYKTQQLLNELAPQKITVPSGSQIKIEYKEEGENPIIAVRLQEIFGWLDTPVINRGKTKLILHLLSPGFKPVQVTSDLKNFWANTYFEVKKELKRRYPKHSWPEDPLAAEAVRGVKRKN
ncbi:ATP-dependent helicase HrpB [Mongoliibacter ruber]|uniref:ATP-dependent helicase HrpB n=1 Tax=Mongoliibacter ruber TaxID=1750599 RepID=A0A2T0WUT1_9BACT|nr:ATP-dependent helicase HrpB [Mongoliibacter ruber]